MKQRKIDISLFEKNTEFYPSLNLIFTIKSFDLQSIRKRYLDLRAKKNVSGKTGSIERREVSKGGVAKVCVRNGKLEELVVVNGLPEPRGIDCKNQRFGISLENTVYIFYNNNTYQLIDPWFSYIHTVDFHANETEKVLITSSGYECVMEFDFTTQNKLWQWFAWDNGLDEGNDPKDNTTYKLTRHKHLATTYEKQKKPYLFIENPENQNLPTALRAAFINSARYDISDFGNIFLTLFHEGTLRSLSKESGDHFIVMDGMKSPHGGRKLDNNTIIFTDTAGGNVELLKKEERITVSFRNLSNKPEELHNLEWLQNSINLDSIIITIDSNRNAIVIIDIEAEKYDFIPYDKDWAVQDMVLYDEKSEAVIAKGLEFLSVLNK